MHVIPSMCLIRQDCECLADPVWEDELVGQEITIGTGGGVNNAEGVLADSGNGFPGVDDFEAACRIQR